MDEPTKTNTATEMLAVARRYRDAGISVLPIAAESKRPVGKWKHLETELINDAELEKRYMTPFEGKFPNRIAVIGGQISGGLEMIDFDVAGIEWNAWCKLVPHDLFEKLLIERTMNGGYHVAYRCEEIGSNRGLCYRFLFDDAKQKEVWKATIETRGEGGYCVVAPSDGYTLIQGDWCHLNVISPTERDQLIDAAKSLNQRPSETVSQIETPSQPIHERPGDVFNNDANTPQTILKTLLKHGWTLSHDDAAHWFLKHPGNTSREHSTTLSKTNGFLHTFSPNTPFEQGKNVPPFETFSVLEANGDYSAAASLLAENGFVQKPPQVDLSHLLANMASKPAAVSTIAATTKNIIPGSEALKQYRADLYSGEPPLLWDVGFGELKNIEFAPQRVLVFGGAPGSGKTALAMQLAIDALSLNPDLRLVVANVEMSPAVLLERQIARFSGVPLGTIQLRTFTDHENSLIDDGIQNLAILAERLTFVVPPIDLRIVGDAISGYGGDLVIIDYLQRIPCRMEQQHKELRVEMNRIMDTIRIMASSNRCVIGLSSLNRVQGKEGYDPNNLTLSSFKESGEIEYGADDCFGVCLAKPHSSGSMLIPIKHLKSRHGERKDFELLFNGALQSFSPVHSATFFERK